MFTLPVTAGFLGPTMVIIKLVPYHFFFFFKV